MLPKTLPLHDCKSIITSCISFDYLLFVLWLMHILLLFCYEDVNCDFGPKGAKTMCAWQQVTDDEFEWTLRRGDTPSYFTGPKFDHTTTEGDGV